jgi:tetratricopeptide (TPR) repeat protein
MTFSADLPCPNDPDGMTIESASAQIDFYYQRALIAKAQKNFPQALADCQQILNRDPQHLAARSLKAIVSAKTTTDRVVLAKFDSAKFQ